jgi:chromosome segregation ATPase
LRQKLTSRERQLEGLKIKLTEAKEEMKVSARALAAAEVEKVRLQFEIEKLDQRCSDLQALVDKTSAEAEAQTTAATLARQQIAELEARSAELSQLHSQLAARNAELESTIASKSAELEAAREAAKLAQLRLQERNREIGALSLRVAAADEDADRKAAEAEWYSAKSYLANGQKVEAKTLFTQIANNNGYYAPQAKKIVSSF